MILAIRTDAQITYIALIDNDVIVNDLSWESGRTLAKNLLSKISDLCMDTSINISDITGIILFKGPGSFTGLRIGATVSNTLAYASKVPIVGVTGEDWLKSGVNKIRNGADEKIVIPEYGADAHITL